MSLDLFDFDLASLSEEDLYESPAAILRAKAIKTKSRIHARRAKSEAILRDILPIRIEDGDAWHILSGGDVDSLSYLTHLLASESMDHVLLSTWCMAMADVEQILAWLAAGNIKTADIYVGEIFPNQYTAEHETLIDGIRKHGSGRVAVFKNHSKVIACRNAGGAWVIESSANINTNPRAENTVITANPELYQHHKAYFDGINRDFDDWKPA